VGEGGAIIGPPTLVNAIADALAEYGELHLDLPLSPAKILDVIEGRNVSGHAGQPLTSTPAPAPKEEAPVASGGPANVDGEWAMVMSTPMGDQQMTGKFATSGDTVSGELISPMGSQVFSGTVAGNRVKFDLAVEQPMKMTLKYDLTIDGDAMTGKVKMGMFGSSKLTGKRV